MGDLSYDNGIKNFWAKVKKTEGCWEWMGCKQSKGYGSIKVNRKQWRANRFSWFIHNGAIPEGKIVCHRCDNPGCVNPGHLFLGTDADNIRDRDLKGRTARGDKSGTRLHMGNVPRGNNHPMHKLTCEDIPKIRKMLSEGFTLTHIGKQYGVSYKTIGNIKNKLVWTHVI